MLITWDFYAMLGETVDGQIHVVIIHMGLSQAAGQNILL